MKRPIRFVVTGTAGQVVQSLAEKAGKQDDLELVALGRPHLDLMNTDRIAGIVRAAFPDIIVSAGAYTAVDLAESAPFQAFTVNSRAPRQLALAAKAMRIPIIHLSTDYVFDGAKAAPYLETDMPIPLGIYGRSKLDGERSIASVTDNHVILRTGWLYSPFGKNFVKTMLHYAETRDELQVVSDQIGNPTSALDLATAILTAGRNLLTSEDKDLRGTFHLTGSGYASWADFAEVIFKMSQTMGGPFARVRRISSADYPSAARRPAHSCLCCHRIQQCHGIGLPDWRTSTEETVRRLIQIRTRSEASE